MRLIHVFKDPVLAQTFAAFLAKKGVDYQLEQNVDKDWGSTDYGIVSTELWTINEEDLEAVNQWFAEFNHNPSDPQFQITEESFKQFPEEELLEKEPHILLEPENKDTVFRRAPQQPLGPVTLYCLLTCICLFLFSLATTPEIKMPNQMTNIPYPVLLSPVKKALLYDYPEAFELIDRFVNTFGLEKLQDHQPLSPEGIVLVEKFAQTPYWQGMYDKIVSHLQHPEAPWDFNAPLFEKIRQGEIWRLMTPVFLHSDLFHLFFNMIWLIVIGKQIEQRLGKKRYIFFLLLTGIFSNTAQYLMSGSNFLGFSGILCAMIAFIWVRQKQAAWEGYQLQGSTMGFILFFICTMLAIQLISFGLEVYEQTPFSPGIANTAHLSGAFLGYVLGKMPYFSWRGV